MNLFDLFAGYGLYIEISKTKLTIPRCYNFLGKKEREKQMKEKKVYI